MSRGCVQQVPPKTYTLRNILHTCSAASRTVLEHDLHLYDSTPGHQPDMVCQPCSWSAEQGKPKYIFPGFPFTPKNLVSQDRFGRPVPRQPGHSSHTGRICCLLSGLLRKKRRRRKRKQKKVYLRGYNVRIEDHRHHYHHHHETTA